MHSNGLQHHSNVEFTIFRFLFCFILSEHAVPYGGLAGHSIRHSDHRRSPAVQLQVKHEESATGMGRLSHSGGSSWSLLIAGPLETLLCRCELAASKSIAFCLYIKAFVSMTIVL